LEGAVKSIKAEATFDVEAVIDRDTLDTPGSPDISATIFNKIEQCQSFICDVSIINSNTDGRKTPNPNVLVELGFALHRLGTAPIVLVMNKAYGEPDQLPFDLRMKRVLSYSILPEEDHRASEKKSLASKLKQALEGIYEHHLKEGGVTKPLLRHSAPSEKFKVAQELMGATKNLIDEIYFFFYEHEMIPNERHRLLRTKLTILSQMIKANAWMFQSNVVRLLTELDHKLYDAVSDNVMANAMRTYDNRVSVGGWSLNVQS